MKLIFAARRQGRGIIWILFCLILNSGLYAQVLHPYLQSPTDTSVWISWKTDSDTESIADFGELSSSLDMQASGTCQVLSDEGYPANYFYHSVQ